MFISAYFNYIYILIPFWFCVSCSDANRQKASNLVIDLAGREIIISDSLFQGKNQEIRYRYADFKILSYVKSFDGCTECQLQLPFWIDVMRSFRDSIKSARIEVIFIMSGENRSIINEIKTKYGDMFIFIYDKNNVFNRLNENLLSTRSQTLLLNRNNKIIGIGSPILNKGIRRVYIKAMNEQLKIM